MSSGWRGGALDPSRPAGRTRAGHRGRQEGLDQIEITDDNAEEIVEIVCDALCDGADGGGAAGLGEAMLKIDEFAIDRDET